MVRTARILGAVSLLAMMGTMAGCSSAGPSGKGVAHDAVQTVTPTVRVVTDIHVFITANTVIGIIGSYHTCAGQSDGASWVLDTSGNAGALEGKTGLSAPSVELNDTNCALQVDGINTSSTGYTSTNTPSALAFTGPGTTVNAYLASAVGFNDPNTSALSFYANAQSTVVDATGDFALTILVGDDPNIGPASTSATPSVVTGTVSSVGDVLVPDYTTDFSNLTLQDDVNGVAVTVSGTVDLDFVSLAGEEYQTFQAQDLSTASFAQIDSLWNGNAKAETAITGGGSFSVPATSFVSVGDQLPETSSIVIQHVDGSTAIPVYQVLAITFNSHLGT